MTTGVKSAWRAVPACILLLALCGCTNADWAKVARLWEPHHENYQTNYGASTANTSTSATTTVQTETAAETTGPSGPAAANGDSEGDFCHQAAHSAARHATSDGFTPATVQRVYHQQLAQCEALMAQ